MKRIAKLFISLGFVIAFIVWTVLVKNVDVASIGANQTNVGFAGLNGWIKSIISENYALYLITDWLGIVPILFAFAFMVLGLAQWLKRKSIVKVDRSLLALGVFYVVVISVYVLFETILINYRPILIEGRLESSYPSSTTLLVLCIMPTAIVQLRERIRNKILRDGLTVIIAIFTIFMVVGRLLSGVHWISDIVGGVLLSIGLDCAYLYFCKSN
ncbi:MAG: phosphatase PAP2 family protein [Clostridiales bacterium]|nr:phosphatase PAP2 family protein [Clostridiales bacterium]